MSARRLRRLHVLLAAALCLAPLACGYSTRRLDAFPSARSIAVLPFHSSGYRRDLDLRLTQAVAEEIRAHTSYALASRDSADLLLEGEFEADEAVLQQAADRSAVEKRLRGTARITVRDAHTGRVLKAYPAFAISEFTPGRSGESLEGSATEEWIRRIAIGVAQGLEEGF